MKHNYCKYFENFYKNKPGIWYFVPNNFEKYKKNKPCKGFGQIKYGEGSVYTGQIYFDGVNYHKQGYGQQEFTYSSIGNIDPYINEKMYLFVGEFKYKKTNWIYGNGVLYYRDINGNPSRFVKGFFSSLTKIDEYHGEFDYSLLIDGYSREMESSYVGPKKTLIQSELDLLNDVEIPNTLFIGDSYFEFWYKYEFANDLVFNSIADLKTELNIGVGGTRYQDWLEFYSEVTKLPKFKNIVVNLGFNDLHHSINNKPKEIYSDFIEFLNLYRNYFKDANFYILTVCHSPAFPHLYRNEVQYNNLIKKYAKENNVTIIDVSNSIYNQQQVINCFDNDNVHLNRTGYEILTKEIRKYIK